MNKKLTQLLRELVYWANENVPKEKRIEYIHDQIIELWKECLPERKQCSSPNYRPETRVSRDMAIDAGDVELEGSIYENESYEECGGCPECIINQAITQAQNNEEG